MKALVVMGTRPEAIKLAPVIWALEARGHEAVVCSTGQHKELLADATSTFGIVAHYDLDVMHRDQNPNDVLARVLQGMCPVLGMVDPDWVVVEGDTTSVIGAAMAAFHAMAPVAHVEAGLRSGAKYAPFPEEINRRLVTVLADLHCAPTEQAAACLRAEGVPDSAIRITGNPGIDAVRWAIGQPAPRGLPEGEIVTITVHRRENHARLGAICQGIRLLAKAYPRIRWVWPLHPSPTVRAAVDLGGHNINLIEPLDYVSMAHLVSRSRLVLTDSGGLQEEAPSLGVPVIVLRDVTERPEGVQAGVARLVGTDPLRIFAEVSRALDGAAVPEARDLYGGGSAGPKIVDALEGGAGRPEILPQRTQRHEEQQA